MDNENIYTTTSLSVASFLICQKYQLKGTKKNDHQVTFEFEQSDEIDMATQQFFQNTPVPCMDFFDSIKRMKTIVYQTK